MRVAVLLISLCLAIPLIVVSCIPAVVSAGATGQGIPGLLDAFLWLFGTAFVLEKPFVATILFGVAAGLSILAAIFHVRPVIPWALLALVAYLG